jgi:hypothetical protein
LIVDQGCEPIRDHLVVFDDENARARVQVHPTSDSTRRFVRQRRKARLGTRRY